MESEGPGGAFAMLGPGGVRGARYHWDPGMGLMGRELWLLQYEGGSVLGA